MRVGRSYLPLFLFILACAFPVVFAASSENPTSSLHMALRDLCSGVTGTMPTVSMLMVVTGGVIYAAGQVMGSETRAKTNVWATAALTGAVIGAVATAVTPGLLGMVYGADVNCLASGSHGSYSM